MSRRWIIASASVLLAGALGGAWLYAPSFAKHYIEEHYPYVHVGAVKVGFHGLVLTDTRVSRPSLEAQLKLARVSWSKVVEVEGGHLDVTLGGGSGTPKEPGVGHVRITARDLDAHIEGRGLVADLQGVSVDTKQVCFTKGNATWKAHEVTLHDGCVQRDHSHVSIGRAESKVRLPFAIPKIDREQTIDARGIEVFPNDEYVKVRYLATKPFQADTLMIKLDPSGYYVDILKLHVQHPWIAPGMVTFKHLTFTVPRGENKWGHTIMVTIGGAGIRVNPKTRSVEGDESCNTWIDAMPRPLPLALEQAKGHFSGRLSFEVDTQPVPKLDIHYDCKYDCSASPIKDIRHRVFTYSAYDAQGRRFDRKVGPGLPGWTPLSTLPSRVPHAFITLEDPGFEVHRGIVVQALENSLKDNLQLGRFFRGGSTISMQVAKNIWLERNKTLTRKTQEILLTVGLESCLSKADILELYLNIVEMGPNLYGIGPAARHYFHKSPSQLSDLESFYLAHILPNPKHALLPEQGGLEQTRALMKSLAKSGFISDLIVPPDDKDQVDTSGWNAE